MPHVVCEVRCARLSLSPVACNPWPVRLGTATHALPRSQTCIEYHSARSFEFGEKEVQFLIEDGSLSFFYSGSTVRFGKNIYDEEAEELIEKIKKRC